MPRSSSSHAPRTSRQAPSSAAQPLLAAFLNTLQANGGFLCLPCAAGRISSETEMLTSQILMVDTWTGYSFASATCSACGERTYCAIAVGQAQV
jgi:hypothetical protein